MKPKLDVCITADIEFNINGTFHSPSLKCPQGSHSVMRIADGQSHGLGFILNTLDHYGLSATFFVEVLNVHYFGFSEMGKIVDYIQQKNQDLQLHLHPCWRYFKDPNWMELIKRKTPNDSMAGCSLDELTKIVEEGIALFSKLTNHPPLALRAGNLAVDNNVYIALKKAGINLSSNIGLALFAPNEETLRLSNGLAIIEGVTEIPVLTYQLFKLANAGPKKLLTIAGSSWSEINHLLVKAWQQEAGPVVILTHSHEFSNTCETNATPTYLPNTVNQQRFRKLCQFLQKNNDKFETVTFSQRASRWSQQAPKSSQILIPPVRSVLQRIIENKILPLVLRH